MYLVVLLGVFSFLYIRPKITLQLLGEELRTQTEGSYFTFCCGQNLEDVLVAGEEPEHLQGSAEVLLSKVSNPKY